MPHAYLTSRRLAHYSFQLLSSSIGWDGDICATIFRSLERCSIQSDPSIDFGLAMPVRFWPCALGCHSAEKYPIAPDWSQESLERAGFHPGCLRTLLYSYFLSNLPVFAVTKHPHSMILQPPCFSVGIVLVWWWLMPGFPPKMTLDIHTKEFNLSKSCPIHWIYHRWTLLMLQKHLQGWLVKTAQFWASSKGCEYLH